MVSEKRDVFIAGNWKMNKLRGETEKFMEALLPQMDGGAGSMRILLCPPFTALATVSNFLKKSHFLLGAQNMHWEKSGAFTGEISPAMLRDLSVTHVILGHSERRTIFNESDDIIQRKVKAALAEGLTPIICVGESLEDREKGKHFDFVRKQVEHACSSVNQEENIIIAYEPIWAIGTGKTATPEMAQEMHAHIRRILGKELGQHTSILYGGSLKVANGKELLQQPDIDGGLIGGASLDPKEFGEIIHIAREIGKSTAK